MYVYEHICVYMYKWCMCVNRNAWQYACICPCKHVSICNQTCMNICVCMYIWMNGCMHAYICGCIHVSRQTWVSVCIYVLGMHESICVHVCTNIHMYACKYDSMHTYPWIYIYVCIYIWMQTYMYVALMHAGISFCLITVCMTLWSDFLTNRIIPLEHKLSTCHQQRLLQEYVACLYICLYADRHAWFCMDICVHVSICIYECIYLWCQTYMGVCVTQHIYMYNLHAS